MADAGRAGGQGCRRSNGAARQPRHSLRACPSSPAYNGQALVVLLALLRCQRVFRPQAGESKQIFGPAGLGKWALTDSYRARVLSSREACGSAAVDTPPPQLQLPRALLPHRTTELQPLWLLRAPHLKNAKKRERERKSATFEIEVRKMTKQRNWVSSLE